MGDIWAMIGKVLSSRPWMGFFVEGNLENNTSGTDMKNNSQAMNVKLDFLVKISKRLKRREVFLCQNKN